MPDLIAKHGSKASTREHPRQNAFLLGDLFCLGCFYGLLKDAHQVVTTRSLSLKVAVRPVMKQCTKPASQPLGPVSCLRQYGSVTLQYSTLNAVTPPS